MAKQASRFRRVCFAHSSQLLHTAEQHPRFTTRAKLVFSLIEAYGLLEKMDVVATPPATLRELKSFHSSPYISCLHQLSGCGPSCSENGLEEFGLCYDCPLFEGVFEYVAGVGGASLAMADKLIEGSCQVAINWYGGWHHGKRDEASGFCYCNDIVMAILRLQEKYKRVLYIDLDIHHGDGVEEAFLHSSRVLTVSLHKYAEGFFPGTGAKSSAEACINVPLQDGISDLQYTNLFKSLMAAVLPRFLPQCVVLQCGADCLSGDEIGSFNLTLDGIGLCLQTVLEWDLPTLLLGGGGYNFPNTARCWTHLTAVSLDTTLHPDIPEHDHFSKYGPSFELAILPSLRRDMNTEGSLSELMCQLNNYVSKL